MNDKNKIILRLLLVIGIISTLTGISLAFFNYTRTGSLNNLGTGRIYFNSTQSGAINMTNVFPMTSVEASTATLDTVSVGIVGDTTYSDGEEFEITLVDVENTINDKQIPISYIATYTAVSGKSIGSESNDYWNARNSKNADIYTLNETGKVEEGKQVLVGFIKNSNSGIEGTLSIKAYIDADRIAISDTYDGNESDSMGTTNSWVNGRTVFTTTEWNSFSSTPISFKIRAESNKGIWVEEALKEIESCPDCKFIYTTNYMYTTWNDYSETPTVLTSGLYEDYEELIATTGKNYFLGVKLNSSNQITNAYACGIKNDEPFCIEGTLYSDTSTATTYANNKSLLQSSNLYNNTCSVTTVNAGTANEYEETECGPWDGSGSVSAYANSNGSVRAGVSNVYDCYVYSFGGVDCVESDSA